MSGPEINDSLGHVDGDIPPLKSRERNSIEHTTNLSHTI